jgi:hypothetical protein
LKKTGVGKKREQKQQQGKQEQRGEKREKKEQQTSHDIARTLEVSEGLLVLFLFFFWRVRFDGTDET